MERRITGRISRWLAAVTLLVALAYLAACGALYFTQDSYLYFPTARDARVPSFTLSRPDARVVVSTNGGAASDRAVVYFGGNAEDVSMNLVAVDEMTDRFPDLDIIFIESGGDNLAATFSPELADSHIYVIDVGEGEKIPRKGGPGITRSPMLLINKIDIAPYVGSDLGVMDRDARKMRGGKPYLFTNMKTGQGLPELIAWIEQDVLMLEPEDVVDARRTA